MSLQRLDKILSGQNIATRSETKNMVKKGLITVNGQTVKRSDEKFDPDTDEFIVNGIKIVYKKHLYIMMNKPSGVLSASRDGRTKTVIDLLPEHLRRDGLFPAGRLDKDTEGFILITDDGELAHKLLSPRYHVDKTYHVTAEGIITDDDIRRLEEGVDIGEKALTLPAKAEMIGSGQDVSEVLLTIHEGKFHQVKRMFEVIGKPVVHLKRISFGSLKLDEKLAPGEFRRLADEEIKALKGR